MLLNNCEYYNCQRSFTKNQSSKPLAYLVKFLFTYNSMTFGKLENLPKRYKTQCKGFSRVVVHCEKSKLKFKNLCK